MGDLSHIEQELSRTFRCLDHGEANLVPDACTDDFELHAPGIDIDAKAWRQMMEARVSAPYDTRHQWSNLCVLDQGPDGVRLAFVVLASRRDHGSTVTMRTVADFEDRWVSGEKGWLLAERIITPVFDPPAHPD